MSTTAALHLEPLDKKLRGKLETAVKEARDVAEEAALAACNQLGVGRAKPDSHLSEDEKDLRLRLRIHARQLGDKRDPKTEQQEVIRLVEEIAYEHWHRMLFARFLAENQLLMYPDPDEPVAVSLEDCEDLAADEGAANGWELAARFATKMLPQIFRVDSPVFSLPLPPEKQQRLEQLLADLSPEVFTASDSLGWVYQFWQAKRKDEVNASEVKIGARELPAVTQLFTEPYMVSFLLDNSLGAWWAARRLSEDELKNAESEQELREKASLPGVPLEYLRFVREEESGCWTPAAGTFDSWPASLVELKTLDPCCGSGHFLVAALLMLAPMRMELEGLSAGEAVGRVLSENLHGLEIDQRCVELAAFALALAAWRFPDAGGYRPLPDLNVACCGLSVSVAKEEWKTLAKDNNQLRIALDWMYDEFKDAPVLGSLLNPAKSMAAKVVSWKELSPILEIALSQERTDEEMEVAVVAHGIATASATLSKKYNLVITNVPYLGNTSQGELLYEYCEDNYPNAKRDLATVFLLRCIELSSDGGNVSIVLPQNWLFLGSYAKFRKDLLETTTWNMLARLGEHGFDSSAAAGAFTALLSVSRSDELSEATFAGSDASDGRNASEKAKQLRDAECGLFDQQKQIRNRQSVIVLEEQKNCAVLDESCSALLGCSASDTPRFVRSMWEVVVDSHDVWEYLQSSPAKTLSFGGREEIVLWEKEQGEMYELAESVKHLNHKAQQWRKRKAKLAETRGGCKPYA